MELDGLACIRLALLSVILPPRWLAAAVAAALMHEGCHLAAVRLLGGRTGRIYMGGQGARIDAVLPGKPAELAAILAGPAGSLTLLLLARWIPRIAVCGAVQGLFNLLPVGNLDGARALRIVRQMLRNRSCQRNSARS